MGQVIPLNEVRSLRDKVSEEEWQMRCDLAGLYRLVYRFGWDDGIFTHSSVRLPGRDHSDRSVDVLVSRLRRKLGSVDGGRDLIRTVRGVGYVFTASVDA